MVSISSRTDMRAPLINIAMLERNNAGTHAVVIQSITKQTYPHWEFLPVAGGSSDETMHIAQSFVDSRTRIWSDGAWQGWAARLNEAIDGSTATYFARIDTNDSAYRQRLERQLVNLQEHPDVGPVCAWGLVFGVDGILHSHRMNAEHHEAIRARTDHGFQPSHLTRLGRTAFFRKYRYQPTARLSEDADVLLLAYRDSRFATIPEALLRYREEQRRFRKLLIARWSSTCSVMREFERRGKPHLAIKGITTRGLKGAVGCVAVTSSLNYRLLRHRASPVIAREKGIGGRSGTRLALSSL